MENPIKMDDLGVPLVLKNTYLEDIDLSFLWIYYYALSWTGIPELTRRVKST